MKKQKQDTQKVEKKPDTVRMERAGRSVDVPACDVENMIANGWKKA